MRVVLDTNILVRAAFSPTGPAAVVVDLLRSHDHSLIGSEFVLSELNRVLRYPRLLALHRFDDTAILNYVAGIRALSLVVEIGDITPVMSNDPDDDPVIATAVAGHADFLCSCDRHFRRTEAHDYCDFFGIRIGTDLELLSELRETE